MRTTAVVLLLTLVALLTTHIHVAAAVLPNLLSRVASRARLRAHTCQCDCCYTPADPPLRQCVPPNDTVFHVDNCSHCSIAACKLRFPPLCAHASSVVTSACVTRNPWVFRIVPLLVVLAAVALLVYRCFFKRVDGYHRLSSNPHPPARSSPSDPQYNTFSHHPPQLSDHSTTNPPQPPSPLSSLPQHPSASEHDPHQNVAQLDPPLQQHASDPKQTQPLTRSSQLSSVQQHISCAQPHMPVTPNLQSLPADAQTDTIPSRELAQSSVESNTQQSELDSSRDAQPSQHPTPLSAGHTLNEQNDVVAKQPVQSTSSLLPSTSADHEPSTGTTPLSVVDVSSESERSSKAVRDPLRSDKESEASGQSQHHLSPPAVDKRPPTETRTENKDSNNEKISISTSSPPDNLDSGSMEPQQVEPASQNHGHENVSRNEETKDLAKHDHNPPTPETLLPGAETEVCEELLNAEHSEEVKDQNAIPPQATNEEKTDDGDQSAVDHAKVVLLHETSHPPPESEEDSQTEKSHSIQNHSNAPLEPTTPSGDDAQPLEDDPDIVEIETSSENDDGDEKETSSEGRKATAAPTPQHPMTPPEKLSIEEAQSSEQIHDAAEQLPTLPTDDEASPDVADHSNLGASSNPTETPADSIVPVTDDAVSLGDVESGSTVPQGDDCSELDRIAISEPAVQNDEEKRVSLHEESKDATTGDHNPRASEPSIPESQTEEYEDQEIADDAETVKHQNADPRQATIEKENDDADASAVNQAEVASLDETGHLPPESHEDSQMDHQDTAQSHSNAPLEPTTPSGDDTQPSEDDPDIVEIETSSENGDGDERETSSEGQKATAAPSPQHLMTPPEKLSIEEAQSSEQIHDAAEQLPTLPTDDEASPDVAEKSTIVDRSLLSETASDGNVLATDDASSLDNLEGGPLEPQKAHSAELERAATSDTTVQNDGDESESQSEESKVVTTVDRDSPASEPLIPETEMETCEERLIVDDTEDLKVQNSSPSQAITENGDDYAHQSTTDHAGVASLDASKDPVLQPHTDSQTEQKVTAQSPVDSSLHPNTLSHEDAQPSRDNCDVVGTETGSENDHEDEKQEAHEDQETTASVSAQRSLTSPARLSVEEAPSSEQIHDAAEQLAMASTDEEMTLPVAEKSTAVDNSPTETAGDASVLATDETSSLDIHDSGSAEAQKLDRQEYERTKVSQSTVQNWGDESSSRNEDRKDLTTDEHDPPASEPLIAETETELCEEILTADDSEEMKDQSTNLLQSITEKGNEDADEPAVDHVEVASFDATSDPFLESHAHSETKQQDSTQSLSDRSLQPTALATEDVHLGDDCDVTEIETSSENDGADEEPPSHEGQGATSAPITQDSMTSPEKIDEQSIEQRCQTEAAYFSDEEVSSNVVDSFTPAGTTEDDNVPATEDIPSLGNSESVSMEKQEADCPLVQGTTIAYSSVQNGADEIVSRNEESNDPTTDGHNPVPSEPLIAEAKREVCEEQVIVEDSEEVKDQNVIPPQSATEKGSDHVDEPAVVQAEVVLLASHTDPRTDMQDEAQSLSDSSLQPTALASEEVQPLGDDRDVTEIETGSESDGADEEQGVYEDQKSRALPIAQDSVTAPEPSPIVEEQSNEQSHYAAEQIPAELSDEGAAPEEAESSNVIGSSTPTEATSDVNVPVTDDPSFLDSIESDSMGSQHANHPELQRPAILDPTVEKDGEASVLKNEENKSLMTVDHNLGASEPVIPETERGACKEQQTAEDSEEAKDQDEHPPQATTEKRNDDADQTVVDRAEVVSFDRASDLSLRSNIDSQLDQQDSTDVPLQPTPSGEDATSSGDACNIREIETSSESDDGDRKQQASEGQEEAILPLLQDSLTNPEKLSIEDGQSSAQCRDAMQQLPTVSKDEEREPNKADSSNILDSSTPTATSDVVNVLATDGSPSMNVSDRSYEKGKSSIVTEDVGNSQFIEGTDEDSQIIRASGESAIEHGVKKSSIEQGQEQEQNDEIIAASEESTETEKEIDTDLPTVEEFDLRIKTLEIASEESKELEKEEDSTSNKGSQHQSSSPFILQAGVVDDEEKATDSLQCLDPLEGNMTAESQEITEDVRESSNSGETSERRPYIVNIEDLEVTARRNDENSEEDEAQHRYAEDFLERMKSPDGDTSQPQLESCCVQIPSGESQVEDAPEMSTDTGNDEDAMNSTEVDTSPPFIEASTGNETISEDMKESDVISQEAIGDMRDPSQAKPISPEWPCENLKLSRDLEGQTGTGEIECSLDNDEKLTGIHFQGDSQDTAEGREVSNSLELSSHEEQAGESADNDKYLLEMSQGQEFYTDDAGKNENFASSTDDIAVADILPECNDPFLPDHRENNLEVEENATSKYLKAGEHISELVAKASEQLKGNNDVEEEHGDGNAGIGTSGNAGNEFQTVEHSSDVKASSRGSTGETQNDENIGEPFLPSSNPERAVESDSQGEQIPGSRSPDNFETDLGSHTDPRSSSLTQSKDESVSAQDLGEEKKSPEAAEEDMGNAEKGTECVPSQVQHSAILSKDHEGTETPASMEFLTQNQNETDAESSEYANIMLSNEAEPFIDHTEEIVQEEIKPDFELSGLPDDPSSDGNAVEHVLEEGNLSVVASDQGAVHFSEMEEDPADKANSKGDTAIAESSKESAHAGITANDDAENFTSMTKGLELQSGSDGLNETADEPTECKPDMNVPPEDASLSEKREGSVYTHLQEDVVSAETLENTTIPGEDLKTDPNFEEEQGANNEETDAEKLEATDDMTSTFERKEEKKPSNIENEYIAEVDNERMDSIQRLEERTGHVSGVDLRSTDRKCEDEESNGNNSGSEREALRNTDDSAAHQPRCQANEELEPPVNELEFKSAVQEQQGESSPSRCTLDKNLMTIKPQTTVELSLSNQIDQLMTEELPFAPPSSVESASNNHDNIADDAQEQLRCDVIPVQDIELDHLLLDQPIAMDFQAMKGLHGQDSDQSLGQQGEASNEEESKGAESADKDFTQGDQGGEPDIEKVADQEVRNNEVGSDNTRSSLLARGNEETESESALKILYSADMSKTDITKSGLEAELTTHDDGQEDFTDETKNCETAQPVEDGREGPNVSNVAPAHQSDQTETASWTEKKCLESETSLISDARFTTDSNGEFHNHRIPDNGQRRDSYVPEGFSSHLPSSTRHTEFQMDDGERSLTEGAGYEAELHSVKRASSMEVPEDGEHEKHTEAPSASFEGSSESPDKEAEQMPAEHEHIASSSVDVGSLSESLTAPQSPQPSRDDLNCSDVGQTRSEPLSEEGIGGIEIAKIEDEDLTGCQSIEDLGRPDPIQHAEETFISSAINVTQAKGHEAQQLPQVMEVSQENEFPEETIPEQGSEGFAYDTVHDATGTASSESTTVSRLNSQAGGSSS